MSNMRDHAKAELDRINFGEPDTRAMLNILDDIVAEWDSGGAMSAVVPILTKLLAFQPLSPLIGQDDEWYEPMEQEPRTLQNVRCGSVFKTLQPDGSWRAYDIDAPGDCETITFPYDPSKSGRPILATIGDAAELEEMMRSAPLGHTELIPGVEPPQTLAERLVLNPHRSLIDDISRAIEDAYEIGAKRAAAGFEARIAELEAQLQVEGEHTAAELIRNACQRAGILST